MKKVIGIVMVLAMLATACVSALPVFAAQTGINSVNTGDVSNAVLFIIVAVVAAALIVVSVVMAKKKK